MAIDSMPGKLDALSDRVGRLEDRMDNTLMALEENTKVTKEIAAHTATIVDMVQTYTAVTHTATVAGKIGKVTAGIAAGGAAVGGAIATAWHWLRG
jgi:hypothetical protein